MSKLTLVALFWLVFLRNNGGLSAMPGIMKGIGYGFVFWVWYQVCVVIGSHLNPSVAHYVGDILRG